MPTYISLLRAVNVGGKNQIKMDALRGLYESLKFSNVQTYIQSGNVVFKTKAQSRLAERIELAIENEFRFRPSVILRTAKQMRTIVNASPFLNRPGIEPSRLLVTFLTDDSGIDPSAAARAKVLANKAEPEEMHLRDREIYTYYPNGMAQPKLSMAHVERILNVPCTGRNWNTVLKLLEMADALNGL